MTTKHANAELLIGFANGRKLQFKDSHLDASERDHWHQLEADNTEVWPWLLSTDPNERSKRFEFRLAPRTIMIGNIECEAPLGKDEAEIGCDYYSFNAAGEIHSFCFHNSEFSRRILESGMLWRTKEAAITAHYAVTELLTQQPD